ncbi:hypothetical protein DS2_03225 [Catenovulum agarivorans DS-2]|uniref:GlcG protein n=1 Tax=Catenovulum agarivorans DS-2 TaxID=1328313 RepID=W7QR63_9ALTE|nr:heme-binding protein [Catenovulum agarivorans]EWH11487.1 hypothetical protein DS2_03225 [Catenovulum agarivorans DS-2]
MNITLKLAQQLITNTIEIATSKNQQVAVAIVDAHGELLAYARMDGTALHAGVLAQNKAYTSARDRQKTSSLAKWAQQTGKDLAYWTDVKFTGIAGGVPIESNQGVIGAIGISGLAEEDDEALALNVLKISL